jgi:branched-chain amino acid transport system permease protein
VNVYMFWLYEWFRGEVLAIPGRLISIVFFIGLFVIPIFTRNLYVLDTLIITFLFCIYAASWDVLAGFTGQINLGHALFFGVATYIVALLNLHLGFSPLVTIPLGSIGAMVIGLIIALPALRLRGVYLSLVTLGFPIILHGIILIFSEFTGGELGLSGIDSLSGVQVIDYYITLLIMIASLFVMFKFTSVESKIVRFGVILRAIREDEITARSSGINTTRYKILSFAMSGFFAGVAGSLYAHIIRIAGPSTLELAFSFQAIIWTIFAGMTTIYGPVAGVFILYPLTEFLRVNRETESVRFILQAIIMIIIMIFMPEGLTIWIRDKIEVKCPRCKITNIILRQSCRTCNAPLHSHKTYPKED